MAHLLSSGGSSSDAFGIALAVFPDTLVRQKVAST
jgi:hypothetical protein